MDQRCMQGISDASGVCHRYISTCARASCTLGTLELKPRAWTQSRGRDGEVSGYVGRKTSTQQMEGGKREQGRVPAKDYAVNIGSVRENVCKQLR